MNNIENLKKYIENNFQDLKLTRPLFYNSNVGIRFEIGDSSKDDKEYLKGVCERSTKIFEDVFKPDSEIFIVVKSYEALGEYDEDCNFHLYEERQQSPEIEHIIKKYIQNDKVIKEIESTVEPIAELDELNEEFLTRTYCICCTTKDVNYKDMLMEFDYETYFIDKTSGIVYFMYDYRGLDVIAKNTKDLYHIYNKYNDWILDYDKKQIDSLFKNNL